MKPQETKWAGAIGARFVFAAAAVLMAAGIGTAALAAHAGAGHEIGVAASLLLANAPMLAIAGLALAGGYVRPVMGLVGILLGFLGTLLFSADMLHRGFGHGALFADAAPIGGSLDMLAWLVVAGAAAAQRRFA